MESRSQSGVRRGLCNNPRPTPYSKETQDLVRLKMQEVGFNDLWKKQLNECLKILPLTPGPAVLAPPPQPKTRTSVQKCLPCKSQRRRSAESCRSGDSYVREQFRPLPTRDLEKEKRRLQYIFATGQEEPTAAQRELLLQNVLKPKVEEKDRYQEVLDEIEERRQFLADMASLGQERHYTTIINTEISLKTRELEMLDKARSPKKDADIGTHEHEHKRPEEGTLTVTD